MPREPAPSPTAPLLRLFGIVAAALLCRLFLPPPSGIAPPHWDLLILFAFTIVAIVSRTYPMAILVLTSLALSNLLGLLSLPQALKGFSDPVAWIIVAAFMFARAFVKTGLGRRLALIFIRALGRSSLRLGYAVALTDFVLSPVTASNTARAGGIVFPVVRSLAQEFGSRPGPTASRIGSYLLFTAYQANVVTSAFFLTAMAANGVSVRLAQQTVGVELTWALWLKASWLPGAISLLLLPYLIHRAYPPQLQATPEARLYALRELQNMGPPSLQEKVLLAVFLLLAGVWATSLWHGVSTISSALMAVVVLLLSGVLDYRDLAGNRPAWGTFIWFGGIISLSGALAETGVISWFVGAVGFWLGGWGGMSSLILLTILYLYVHYAFAGMTTQIIALYAPFLATAVAAGAPPLLAALVFCFFSSLDAALTHYGDAAAPIFYGSGYIQQQDWWRVGFYLSLTHLLVWLGLGLLWWRWLGLW